MKPIGPLMWEHRLIEKMASLFKREIERNRSQENAAPVPTFRLKRCVPLPPAA